MWSIFAGSHLPSVYIFGEVSVKVFGPVFNQVGGFLIVGCPHLGIGPLYLGAPTTHPCLTLLQALCACLSEEAPLSIWSAHENPKII